MPTILRVRGNALSSVMYIELLIFHTEKVKEVSLASLSKDCGLQQNSTHQIRKFMRGAAILGCIR